MTEDVEPNDGEPQTPDTAEAATDTAEAATDTAEAATDTAEAATDTAGPLGETNPEDAVDDGEVVDELPDDLDLGNFVGPVTFPNNNRRRIPALIYLLLGAGAVAVSVIYNGEAAVNGGLAAGGVLLVAFGLYGLAAGRRLAVDDQEAFATAGSVVGFPVGHASAQQVWRGWLSTPTWRILIFSNENPPKNRGIVLVDGVSGEVVEWFAEENPDQWDDEAA